MPFEQESIWLANLTEADRQELLGAAPLPLSSSPDLAVLGGGLAGLATAYFAAQAGLKVQLLAEDRLALDAEHSLGCIIPNVCGWQFAPHCQPLAQASRDWWAKLAVRPEFRLDWRVAGALMIDPARLAPNPRQHMLAALDAGFSVHDVDAEQIAILEPQLSPCPLGGLHYPSEAVLNPLQAGLGFIKGIRKLGGQITICKINGCQIAEGRLIEIQTDAGTIRPRAIFADDSTRLPSIFGDEISAGVAFEPSRRVYLASTPQPPLLKRPILDSSWIVQLKSGELVIESPSAVDDGAAQTALDNLRQRIPALGGVDFSRTWTGTSHSTATSTPVVNKVTGLGNAWYCGGLDFAATLFAPIIGKSVTDWIKLGQPAEELAPFVR